MSAWQPIDTAPKDGTPILGWIATCGYDGASVFAVVEWYKPLYGREPGHWKLCVCGAHAEDDEWNPEMWMPLPEAPK